MKFLRGDAKATAKHDIIGIVRGSGLVLDDAVAAIDDDQLARQVRCAAGYKW
jgi:hypothetical protein